MAKAILRYLTNGEKLDVREMTTEDKKQRLWEVLLWGVLLPLTIVGIGIIIFEVTQIPLGTVTVEQTINPEANCTHCYVLVGSSACYSTTVSDVFKGIDKRWVAEYPNGTLISLKDECDRENTICTFQWFGDCFKV